MKKFKFIQKNQETLPAAKGFTIIEVMLALAISMLMLLGLLGGIYTSIAQQRYMDSLRDFAEYIRTMYSEVISPQSLGLGNSSDYAILGKALVFGSKDGDDNTVYSATIVGRADIPLSQNESFIGELSNPEYNVQLFCGDSSKAQDDPGHNSTVEKYIPLWQSQFREAGAENVNKKFTGTLVIARPLTSATVHTAFLKDITYDFEAGCTPDNKSASTEFANGLKTYNYLYERSLDESTDICVKPDGAGVIREVQIAADGRNTSAVLILDDRDSQCR